MQLHIGQYDQVWAGIIRLSSILYFTNFWPGCEIQEKAVVDSHRGIMSHRAIQLGLIFNTSTLALAGSAGLSSDFHSFHFEA